MRLSLPLAALLLFGCSDPTPSPAGGDTDGETVTADAPAESNPGEERQSLVSVVEANPRLTTLLRLVGTAGLSETLADTSVTYTLFAPSDAAFAALGDAVGALDADSAAARAVLLDHVLSTRMLSVDVFPDLSIETVGGAEVSFAEVGDGLAVVGPLGTARITDADLDADNGVVHIIDTVLSNE